MKKAIVLLLALALIGGTAFAQLTFNGYERGLVSINDGSVTYANRLRMNISANDPDGMFGVGGRIQYDGDAIGLKGAYGWVKMADGVIKLTAGKLMVYDYFIGSGLSDYKLGNISSDRLQFDGTDGFMAQLFPVEGLNVGVAVTPTAAMVNLANFSLNAKYTIADVGDLVVSSQLNNLFAESFGSVAFNFKGVEGLAAAAGLKVNTDLGYKKAYNAHGMNVFGVVTYTAGSLGVQVAPDYDLENSELYVEGYVSYMATESFAVRVLGAYDQSGLSALGAAAVTAVAADPVKYIPAVTAVAAKPSTFFGGVELVLTVGKGSFMTGFWYDEYAKWSVPMMVKVGF